MKTTIAVTFEDVPFSEEKCSVLTEAIKKFLATNQLEFEEVACHKGSLELVIKFVEYVADGVVLGFAGAAGAQLWIVLNDRMSKSGTSQSEDSQLPQTQESPSDLLPPALRTEEAMNLINNQRNNPMFDESTKELDKVLQSQSLVTRGTTVRTTFNIELESEDGTINGQTVKRTWVIGESEPYSRTDSVYLDRGKRR
jgi:hypothetical protein